MILYLILLLLVIIFFENRETFKCRFNNGTHDFSCMYNPKNFNKSNLYFYKNKCTCDKQNKIFNRLKNKDIITPNKNSIWCRELDYCTFYNDRKTCPNDNLSQTKNKTFKTENECMNNFKCFNLSKNKCLKKTGCGWHNNTCFESTPIGTYNLRRNFLADDIKSFKYGQSNPYILQKVPKFY